MESNWRYYDSQIININYIYIQACQLENSVSCIPEINFIYLTSYVPF